MRQELVNRPTIGILGGTGPAATAHLFSRLVAAFQATGAAEDHDFPSILIHSVAVPGTTSAGAHAHPDLPGALGEALSRLAAAGADIVAVACNSLHTALGNICVPAGVEMFDMVELAAVEASSREWSRVGVCASHSSRTDRLFHQAFTSRQMATVELSGSTQDALDAAIAAVMAGTDTTASRTALEDAIVELRSAGADGVVVGCTELSVIAPTGARLIDTAELLVAALVSRYIPPTRSSST